MISKGKKVFRLIQGGSLSLCKCRRARIKEPAGRTWSAGRSLPMSGTEPREKHQRKAVRHGKAGESKLFPIVQ